MASATRPWCNSVARKDPEVRAWLSERENRQIPLIQGLVNKQKENNCEVVVKMPLGTWLLDLPEMEPIKKQCFGENEQVTDFCEFGLKDPENKLPHKRPTALLSTFRLKRALKKCSGHNGLAHQWTKGYLSKRFGGVSRLGYSQKWTSMFCRDLIEDFADHLNPLSNHSWATGATPVLGTHQSRSTYGLQRKVNNVFGNKGNKCVRCEGIRRGLARATRSLKHDRDKPDCKYYGQPFDPKQRAPLTGLSLIHI